MAKTKEKSEKENVESTDIETALDQRATAQGELVKQFANDRPGFGDDYETVSEKDGRVIKLAPGEIFEGAFIGEGRMLGEDGKHQIGSFAFVPISGDADKILIMKHRVLESAIEHAIKEKGLKPDGKVVFKIAYEGPKQNNEGETYHAYQIAGRNAHITEWERAQRHTEMKA